MNIKPAVWFPTIRTGTGTEIFTARLVEGLQKTGIRAEITWLPHRAEFLPWTIPNLKAPGWANIVHVNTWCHTRLIPQGLPVVATVHTCVHDAQLAPYTSYLQSLYHRYWIKRLEKSVLGRASQIVCVSNYVRRKTEEWSGISSQVIHNGVELVTPIEERASHFPFRLFYAGNWKNLKGVNLLSPIMSALGEGFELWFTADANGADKKVVMPTNCKNIGRLNQLEMAEAYRSVDALLFPTRIEGLPLVAIEAMSHGLPVISTKGSSLPEVVNDGIDGYLCPQDNVASFKEAAERLAQDKMLWLKMSKAAQERVRQVFSLERMVSEYINIYMECLRPG